MAFRRSAPWLSVTVSASSRAVTKDSRRGNRSRCLSLLVGQHARKIESSPWAWCRFVKGSSEAVALRTRSSANEAVESSLAAAGKPSTSNGLSESSSVITRSGPTSSFWFANCVYSEHFASLIVRSAKCSGSRSKSNALITSSRIPKSMPSSAYHISIAKYTLYYCSLCGTVKDTACCFIKDTSASISIQVKYY